MSTVKLEALDGSIIGSDSDIPFDFFIHAEGTVVDQNNFEGFEGNASDPFLDTETHTSTEALLKPSKSNFSNEIKYAYIETYLHDGYDIRKKYVVTSQGPEKFCKPDDYDHYQLSVGLILATLLGFPSRIAKITQGKDAKPRYQLHLDWHQFFSGFIGGWDPLHEKGKLVWTAKKALQIAALPIKILIILPLKIMSFPFKLLINIAKLFTEFLPSIISYFFGPLLAEEFDKLRKAPFDSQLGYSRLWLIPVYFVTTLLSLIPFLLFRAIKFFGMTITSPDKSARISYTYAYKAIRPLLHACGIDKHSKLGRALSYTAGVFSAILSVLTTAGLWAVTFPLLFGAAVAYIPLLQQAVLWISQFPVIASFLTTLESALALVGIGTAHAYGAFIATISTLFSFQVSTMLLLVGTAFGALAAPVFTAISRVADVLSDWWASWQKQPLSTHLLSLFIPTKLKKSEISIQLNSAKKSVMTNHFSMGKPGDVASDLVEASSDSLESASLLLKRAGNTGDRAGSDDFSLGVDIHNGISDAELSKTPVVYGGL